MNQYNLNKKLPTYKAPGKLWDKIEAQLDIIEREQNDKNIVSKLPSYKAPEIFENIAPPPKQKIIKLTTLLKVAASVAIIIGVGFGLNKLQNKAQINIAHSIEHSTNPAYNSNNRLYDLNNNFQDILNEKCKTKPAICKQSAYEELTNQLRDIERETEALNQTLKQYKSSEIESHLVRLTNDKIKIENYILKLF